MEEFQEMPSERARTSKIVYLPRALTVEIKNILKENTVTFWDYAIWHTLGKFKDLNAAR